MNTSFFPLEIALVVFLVLAFALAWAAAVVRAAARRQNFADDTQALDELSEVLAGIALVLLVLGLLTGWMLHGAPAGLVGG